VRHEILIVGMGGFGREVAEYLHALEQHWVIRWVDDRNPDADFNMQTAPFDSERPTIVAIGNPELRHFMMDAAVKRGAQLPCFSFDGAIVRSRPTPNSGVIVCPHSIITAGVKLRRGVQINLNCVVGHDVELGEFATLSPSVDIMGGAKLGYQVFVGAGATILPNVYVGDHAVIGAGAVVVRDVPDYATVVGNPAKAIKR